MKNLLVGFFSLTFFLLISLYGCSPKKPIVSTDLQESFIKSIGTYETNSSLSLEFIPGEGKNKFGSDINIIVENNSDEYIVLSNKNSLVRVFLIVDNEWQEIDNNNVYFGEDTKLSPRDKPGSKWITWVRPVADENILSETEKSIIRIFVSGYQIQTDGVLGKAVSAYTDLFIE